MISKKKAEQNPETTVVPEATASKKTAKELHSDFRLVGQKLGETMSEADKAAEGSKSNTVEFIGCLGDPAHPRNRRGAGNKDYPSLVVVGYAFKVLEDTEVPRAALKPDFKSLIDCDAPVMEPVKAGTTVYLNIFETGVFISDAKYAGQFTGNGTGVALTVKFSLGRPDPLPVLNKIDAGSIKTNMIEIATAGETDENGKVKNWVVKDEFAEKFGVLYKKKTASRRGSNATAKSGESAKELARAFQQYIHKK